MRRVKMTQPKSPLHSGATKWRADSSHGRDGPRSTGIMPSPRDAISAGTMVTTVMTPITAYAHVTSWNRARTEVVSTPARGPAWFRAARNTLDITTHGLG